MQLQVQCWRMLELSVLRRLKHMLELMRQYGHFRAGTAFHNMLT